MEKRYQVFISSTFQDLQPARQEVSQALLRADCFPAGMELFPAADEEQFEFIKQIIDQSDYYIIISAGRYGSIHPETGLSYTEMEYDYAFEVQKPIIRLLHSDPFNKLTGEFIEATEIGREKLKKFRKKMSQSLLCKMWDEPEKLGAETAFALLDLIRRKPATGWVRGNDLASSDAKIQILQLEREVAELKLEVERYQLQSNIDIGSELSELRGDFEFNIIDYAPNDSASERVTLKKTEAAKAICKACLDHSQKRQVIHRVLTVLSQKHPAKHGIENRKFSPEGEIFCEEIIMELEGKGLLSLEHTGVSEDGAQLTKINLDPLVRRWAAKDTRGTS